jgi:hypothetical protein
MAAFENDGSIPYGSQVLLINSVNYIADSIEFQRPSKEINRTNELDEPTGSVNYEDFHRATATLQLAAAATAIPAKGQDVTILVGGANVNFFVYDVTIPLQKDQDQKVNVTFKRKYN